MFTFIKHHRTLLFLLFAGLGVLCALQVLTGCRSLPNSGLDPYGERLFESRPFADCPLFNRRADSSPTIINSTPIAGTSTLLSDISPDAVNQIGTGQIESGQSGINQDGASTYTPPVSALPGNLGASRTNPAVPPYSTTTTAVSANEHAVTTALIPSPDAGPIPIFVETGGYALPTVPVIGPALIMTPREQIAPLGSEVVLIACRLGNKDRLITNEKIEWALEGVGTLEEYDRGSHCDFLFLDYVKARKVTDRYAVTKTSQVYQSLNRGTSDTTDDIHLLRGQTWVSINSMREGTTHVTAFAPNMGDWSKRTDVGIIHWVDAQWVLPRLSTAPVGESRVLTTTVLQATNGQPRRGWIVRYEILNGPAADLGASGAQIEEVETDLSGQATTILTPGEQRAGTNTIGIHIIRPPRAEGDRRITVGSEMVRQTWSGSPNILLNIRGPGEARLGQELLYEITAENRSSSSVQGVIALPIPPLASYIRSEPAGMLQGSTVFWNVNLSPRNITTVRAVLRQGAKGSLWLRPEFRRTSESIVSSPVVSASVSVSPAPSNTGTNTAATRYPPATLPASSSQPTRQPVSLFPANAPNSSSTDSSPLSVEIAPALSPDNHFRFRVSIKNTGTTEIKEISALIPFPKEFDKIGGYSDTLSIDGNPPTPPKAETGNLRLGIDSDTHQAIFKISSLASNAVAHAWLEYPRIGPSGLDISCTVYVNEQQVTQKTQRIVP